MEKKIKCQNDSPPPVKNKGIVSEMFIDVLLVQAPRLETRYEEKQIFFVKTEVKKNKIHTCKLLQKWVFLKKKKDSQKIGQLCSCHTLTYCQCDCPSCSPYKNPIISLNFNQAEISISQGT